MKKHILMYLALAFSILLFGIAGSARADEAKDLRVDIMCVSGNTHTGGEITFRVRFYGTAPYDIYYYVEEEGYEITSEFPDVEYGHEESDRITWDGDEWEFSYTPHDPAMHVILTLDVYDNGGACVEGISASVFSVPAVDPGKSLFKITTRYFNDQYRSRWTSEYKYTDEFPQNFGNDRDYWVQQTDNGVADKSVSFCNVGVSPRELCAFDINDLGVVVHYCVPSMPEPLRLFAERNGLNAIKYYFERMPGYSGPFSVPGYGNSGIFFYQDQLELLPIANSNVYPANGYGFDYRGWIPELAAGEIYKEIFLRISGTERGSVASFGMNEYVSRSQPSTTHSGGVVSWMGNLDNFLKENPGYTLRPDGSYREDRDDADIYGQMVLRKDSSIYFTDTSLEMSDEEARWLVYYMEETLKLEHAPAYEPAPTAVDEPAVAEPAIAGPAVGGPAEENALYPWISAYENWIKSKRFLYDGKGRSHVNDYYIEPVKPDDLFSRNALRPFRVSLWDFDWDGIPELLIDIGGDFEYGGIAVYSWNGDLGNVIYSGSIAYYEQAAIHSCASCEYTGLVAVSGDREFVEYDYYFMDGDQLIRQPVFDAYYFGSDDHTQVPEEPSYIARETDDDVLFALALDESCDPLMFFGMRETTENDWFSGFVKPALENQIYSLVCRYVREENTVGYQHYLTLPKEWSLIQQALDLTQFNLSGMNIYAAKREMYFDTALKACGNSNEAVFMKDGWVIDDLKMLKSFADFNEDYFFNELAKVVPERERSFLGTNGDDLKSLIHEYLDKDISEQEMSLQLNQMGLFHQIRHRSPLYQNMHNLKLLRIATKAMNIIGTVGKFENLAKTAVKIVNQINLLESLDRQQLEYIAVSYSDRGDAEMNKVGAILKKFLNATDEEKVVMLITEELKDIGLDELYSVFEKELMKHAGGLASSVYTIVYMTIDHLTGIGELTDSNNQMLASAENMHQFFLDTYNFVLYYQADPNDNSFRRMVYAYLTYYSSVISTNGKYQNLVSTGEKAVLKDLINNDAMRAASERSKEDNVAYLAFMQQVRRLFDPWNYGGN